ncbi:hypothetical protein FDP41_008450 [Naegleria fowleri]|uniref:ASCH domain-containing protein n=1 Tax=Naegleria fowleri TaxID=5763 RepID=A0A6A5B231_NAEFO|nr:uncharacterized protein FDP41_008450 [Naegleria fowleri]KAF0973243.1 hypothetical protein FDP41_008450 [Naegleria fowleri]
MSNNKKTENGEFPSLPQQDRSFKQIGDAIGHIPVKFAKKKGGGTSGQQFHSHKPSAQHSQPQSQRNDLSDKAYENLSRINKKFEFADLLKNNRVLTNCTCCGKIITAEGFGPCPFCQTNITPEAVTQYYNSADDFNLSKNKKENEDYLKALELRNRLLRWDENYSQTTAVIDEQAAEYGNSSTSKDIWLSDSEKKQREKIEERIKELKEQLKNRSGPLRYTFDFAGKRILLDESHQIETQKEIDRLMESLKVTIPKSNISQTENINVITREGSSVGTQRSALLDVTKLKYIESKEKKNKPNVLSVNEGKSGGVVQNQYYIEDDEPACDISSDSITCGGGVSDTIDGFEPIIQYCEPISTHEDDQGFCLSMHQPWCSLLVYGIKRHEGRSWNTSHRGRLWIASTAEKPTDESIQELETYYKTTFNRTQGYPKHYPTSVIVGCVDVIDCVSSEEYREKFPSEEQESDSDYVFICANPRRLFLPYPISGKPKIYKLTKEQLEACQLGLKPLPPSTFHQ